MVISFIGLGNWRFFFGGGSKTCRRSLTKLVKKSYIPLYESQKSNSQIQLGQTLIAFLDKNINTRLWWSLVALIEQTKVKNIQKYPEVNSCPNLTIFFINESRKIVPFFSFFSSNLHDLNTDLIYCLQIYKSTIIVLCLGRN